MLSLRREKEDGFFRAWHKLHPWIMESDAELSSKREEKAKFTESDVHRRIFSAAVNVIPMPSSLPTLSSWTALSCRPAHEAGP